MQATDSIPNCFNWFSKSVNCNLSSSSNRQRFPEKAFVSPVFSETSSNVLPTPSTLRTSIRPPIKSTSCRVIANPNPNPSTPCAEESRVKAWNICSKSSRAIPRPVSLTEKTRYRTRTNTWIVTVPRAVNFKALDNKLSTICLILNGSPEKLASADFSTFNIRFSCFLSATGCIADTILSNNTLGLKAIRFISNLWDSKRWKSSKSLTSESKWSDDAFMFCK